MRVAPFVVLIVAAVTFTGCGTLVGLTVGLGIDAAQPDSATLVGPSLASIVPGTHATLRLQDGMERDVVIGSSDLESLDAYSASVEERQRHADPRVPLPPVSVRLRVDRTIHPHARLEGYDREGLWIALDTFRLAAFLPWARVKHVAVAGEDGWTGDSLRGRCLELGIPSRSGRWILSSGIVPRSSAERAATVREFVRYSDIDRIVVVPSSNAVWWGLAAGAVTDLLIVAAANQSMLSGTFRIWN